jgi:hypothetical protein
MINGVFDGWDSTDYTLVVCDFLVSIEWDVEVNLAMVNQKILSREHKAELTRMSTRLSLRSTSWMESLLDRDILNPTIMLQLGFVCSEWRIESANHTRWSSRYMVGQMHFA